MLTAHLSTRSRLGGILSFLPPLCLPHWFYSSVLILARHPGNPHFYTEPCLESHITFLSYFVWKLPLTWSEGLHPGSTCLLVVLPPHIWFISLVLAWKPCLLYIWGHHYIVVLWFPYCLVWHSDSLFLTSLNLPSTICLKLWVYLFHICCYSVGLFWAHFGLQLEIFWVALQFFPFHFHFFLEPRLNRFGLLCSCLSFLVLPVWHVKLCYFASYLPTYWIFLFCQLFFCICFVPKCSSPYCPVLVSHLLSFLSKKFHLFLLFNDLSTRASYLYVSHLLLIISVHFHFCFIVYYSSHILFIWLAVTCFRTDSKPLQWRAES